jgi:hypothetical protein
MGKGLDVENDEPRNVLSMILKLETLERKSEARGAYGLRCDWSVLGGFEREDPRFPLGAWTPLVWTPLVSFVSGTWTTSLFSAGKTSQVGHILKMTVMKGEESISFKFKGLLCMYLH